ncbi:MAG TPA: methyltransferase domain-containing protein [Alphaproteobacteria bacterium]|nr:methyltransferase domain-containing protein [Alphaproteobacteria bacterium]
MSVAEHYENLLADHYSWMRGPFDDGVAGQRALLSSLGLPQGGRALDLGCGAGLQSVALAEMKFDVTAVDSSRKLLDELSTRGSGLPIRTIEGDIMRVAELVEPDFDVAVCMGDTLTHLPTVAAVERMFDGVAGLLRRSGLFVLTFRDLTGPPVGSDSGIFLVREDQDTIMRCMLHYDENTVLVTDMIHVRDGTEWKFNTSKYRKLRLAPRDVADLLEARGFSIEANGKTDGGVLIAARRN